MGPCDKCERWGTCEIRGGCERWIDWVKTKSIRYCTECGKEIKNPSPRARLCDECRKENRRAQKRQERASYKSIITHEKSEPDRTLSEQNRFMRERGFTYGGKTILQCSPLEPKFLEGVKTRWNKTESGDCGGESR